MPSALRKAAKRTAIVTPKTFGGIRLSIAGRKAKSTKAGRAGRKIARKKGTRIGK